MKKVLVTGAAGYIGSNLVKSLEKDYQVIAFDDLSNGNSQRISSQSVFYQGSITSKKLLTRIFKSHNIDTVFHLAALKDVTESICNPRKYMDVNYQGTQNIVEIMKKFNCERIVFSSTAAVYGNKEDNLYSEEMPCAPINPYGESKLRAESYLKADGDIKSAILRYFNLVGGKSQLMFDRESQNLFNNIMRAISLRKSFQIYGGDLPTHDGTCIRDFINVGDVVDAHLKAHQYLESDNFGESLILNIGRGSGNSILEVINKFEEIAARKINVEMCDSRIGDPYQAVASVGLAAERINFRATTGLETSISETLAYY